MATRQQTAAARREGIRARHESLVSDTAELRDRYTPIIESVGGWDLQGLAPDLAHLAFHLRPGGSPQSFDAYAALAYRLVNEQTMSPESIAIWTTVAEELEKGENPQHYFSLLREAKGLIEAMPGGAKASARDEWPYDVRLVGLDELMVDKAYQRPPDWTFIRRKAAIFDERLVGVLDVSQRKTMYALMDGQQRSEMMRLVGKTKCFVAVYENLPVSEEAAFFVAKNRDRKYMHPWYTYNALVTAKDPSALAIKGILDQHGYKLAIGGVPEENITAIKAVENSYDLDQGASLGWSMELIKDVWWRMPGSKSAHIIRGLARFGALYPDAATSIVKDAMVDLTPQVILSKAQAAKGVTTGSALHRQVTTLIVEEYNRRARGTSHTRLSISESDTAVALHARRRAAA